MTDSPFESFPAFPAAPPPPAENGAAEPAKRNRRQRPVEAAPAEKKKPGRPKKSDAGVDGKLPVGPKNETYAQARQGRPPAQAVSLAHVVEATIGLRPEVASLFGQMVVAVERLKQTDKEALVASLNKVFSA